MVIGRFQKASKVSDEQLIKIIKSKRELDGLPVVARADFGHTSPIITFPIGGFGKLTADKDEQVLRISKH